MQAPAALPSSHRVAAACGAAAGTCDVTKGAQLEQSADSPHASMHACMHVCMQECSCTMTCVPPVSWVCMASRLHNCFGALQSLYKAHACVHASPLLVPWTRCNV